MRTVSLIGSLILPSLHVRFSYGYLINVRSVDECDKAGRVPVPYFFVNLSEHAGL